MKTTFVETKEGADTRESEVLCVLAPIIFTW